MFPVLALMVEFCVGIVTVDALELARIFSQAKNFMKPCGFQRAIFQAAPQVIVGMCPVGLAWLMWGGFSLSCFLQMPA